MIKTTSHLLSFLTTTKVRVFCLTLALCASCLAQDVYKDSKASPEARVADLISKMTLEEKITLLGGTRDTCIPGNKRLGIPLILMSDGPHGVRAPAGQQNVKAAALPVGMALAATFDPELAYRYGEVLAREAKANGIHLMLAPAVNLYRYPICGRNFEYLGEDPFLAGVMGVAEVKGLQAHKVGTSLKHYAANNQEFFRWSASSNMDERTLHEIYLAAFERVVKEADPTTVMAGLNPVNGVLCIQNDYLNNQVLKGKWGYKGPVVSDWSGTRETLAAAKGGLDLEMPRGNHFNIKKLKPLLESGQIDEKLIDEKVSRILRMYFTMGWFDNPTLDSSIPKDNPDSDAFALEVAQKGIVLLKNEQNILPFDAKKIKKLAVLGPNAERTPSGGGGSSQVKPFHTVNILDGLHALLGEDIEVQYVPYPYPPNYYESSLYASPVKFELYKAEFYQPNTEPSGKPVLVREEDKIDMRWEKGKRFAEGVNPNIWMAYARWTTSIRPEKTGEYLLCIDTAVRAKVSVFLNNEQVLPRLAQCNIAVPVKLEGGKTYTLKVQGEIRHGGRFRLGWGPKTPIMGDDLKKIIAGADAVVACVGFNNRYGEGEDSDRIYALPGRQAEWIREAAAINPNLAVVLNSGGSVQTSDWLGDAKAFVQAWYPGQQGGTAIAEILFGKVNPSGHLPFTWEKRIEDSPAFGNYPTDLSPNNNTYKEGIFIGYRGFDKKGVTPLYPFGYGLSYTNFALSNASIEPSQDDEGWTVSVDVSNTGKRDGAAVVQGYVKPPSLPDIERPVRELKTFKRVTVKAGQTVRATLTLKRADIGYYDVVIHDWRLEPGDYSLQLGFHANDDALQIPFTVEDNRFPDGLD